MVVANVVGLNVLCLNAVVHAASRRAWRDGVWDADLDGSISPDFGGVLGLAVSDMVGNLAVPCGSLVCTSTPSFCMLVV